MAFKFEKLEAYLKKKIKGFKKAEVQSGFQIIKIKRDFKKAYQEGKIAFREDGIYLKEDGKEYRGYMFLSEYSVSLGNTDNRSNLPKRHLVKCKTITDFLEKGTFKYRYQWTNSKENDITDRLTGKIYKDKYLDLCGNCKNCLGGKTEEVTEEIYKGLLEQEVTSKKVNRFTGRSTEWRKISREFRASKDYKCERCKVQAKERGDYKWWDAHHKDRDRTNDDWSNLECLCIVCHANVDDYHKSMLKRKKRYKAFKAAYQADLKACGNPYI